MGAESRKIMNGWRQHTCILSPVTLPSRFRDTAIVKTLMLLT
jgi:hypothetical protein